MKRKSHSLILLSWIHDVLLFEGVYIFADAVQHTKEAEIGMILLKGLFMLLPIVLSYIVVCRCQRLWIFFVFSAALTWGMKTVSGSMLTGGLTAFICLFRCHVRLKQGEIRRKMKELPGEAGIQEDEEVWEVPTLLDAPRIPHCLIFVLMYLGVIYLQRYEYLRLMLGILAAEVCVCLAYRYLERMEGFVKKNIRVANLPAGAMKRIGTGILMIGITMLIICMIPAAVYQEEPLSKIRLGQADMSGMEVVYFEESSEPDYILEELMRLKGQANKTPEWLLKASEVVSGITAVGIVCLALKLILKAIRRAMESFADNGGDEIIFLDKESDEERRKSLLRTIKKDHSRSADKKIRRLYKRLIKRALREKPCGSETPQELEDRAGLSGREEMNRIHELYEKVRYGREECTREEVKQYVDIFTRIIRCVSGN